MSKYTMKSTLREIIADERAVQIIKKSLPFVMNHPRFSEAIDYSLEAVLNDDLGRVIGVSKARVNKIFKEIIDLDE